MGKAYSLDLREKVISFISRGKSKRESSKVFTIGEDTIYRWLRLHKAKNLAPKKYKEYPRKIADEVLQDYIEKNPDHTLKEIGQSVGLHSSKIWKYLKRLGITRKKRQLFIQNAVKQKEQNLKKK
jgi:transposase